MATLQTLRQRVERNLMMRRRSTAVASESFVGNVWSEEKINDALNNALAWMDITLVDMKDGRAWFDFTTQNSATVYNLPAGTKKPVLGVEYDYEGTPVYCHRIVIQKTQDRYALNNGSFFQKSANQSFFADMESVGVDGLELFIYGGLENSKKVKYWANVEFSRMTSDNDDLSLGERLEKLMVDYATGYLLNNVPGKVFGGQGDNIIKECENLAKLYNSWRN